MNDVPGSATLAAMESDGALERATAGRTAEEIATYAYRGAGLALDHVFRARGRGRRGDPRGGLGALGRAARPRLRRLGPRVATRGLPLGVRLRQRGQMRWTVSQASKLGEASAAVGSHAGAAADGHAAVALPVDAQQPFAEALAHRLLRGAARHRGVGADDPESRITPSLGRMTPESRITPESGKMTPSV